MLASLAFSGCREQPAQAMGRAARYRQLKDDIADFRLLPGDRFS